MAFDLPMAALIEEDRLWRVTNTPPDERETQIEEPKKVHADSPKIPILKAQELSITEIPVQVPIKTQDLFGSEKRGSQDLPRSFNSWRANSRSGDHKEKQERAKVEMERLMAQRKSLKNADMPRPFEDLRSDS